MEELDQVYAQVLHGFPGKGGYLQQFILVYSARIALYLENGRLVNYIYIGPTKATWSWLFNLKKHWNSTMAAALLVDLV
jgi:hypothetical protein